MQGSLEDVLVSLISVVVCPSVPRAWFGGVALLVLDSCQAPAAWFLLYNRFGLFLASCYEQKLRSHVTTVTNAPESLPA